LFFLAKELGTTVADLTTRITQEELLGWAAFFELKNEQEEKALEQAKRQGQSRSMRSR